jgi:hypothetical protein
MEKNIVLNQTGAARMRHCNKSDGASCHHKQQTQHPAVADQASESKANILQLYYAALIQYHSSGINNGNQDTSYLHCT